MLIDWFTVGAQVVNFLVLVWLLKRYLYGPMLTAIDAREKDIASRRAAAVAEQEAARKKEEEFQRQKDALEQQRLALLTTAQEEAKAERTRLLAEATHEADNLRAARQKELEEETASYRANLIGATRQEIIALVRKVLSDLASAKLEDSAVEVFLRHLDENPALKNGDSPQPSADAAPAVVRLRSAFALSPAQQEAIRAEVQKKFQTGAQVNFEITPELGFGLELTVHDQKTAWTLDSYLASFERHIEELADPKSPTVSP